MRTAVLLTAQLTVALANLAFAQEQPPARPSGPVLVDSIVATVNDSPILLSELRTSINGRLNTERLRLGQLSAKDEAIIARRQLYELIDRRRMAQSAKTFGGATPEQVEDIVQRELDRDRQEMVRDVGTETAMSRELQRQGRTWPTMQSERRVEKLAMLAEEFSINQRLARQTNLYVTPLMLRQTFANPAHNGRFVHEAAALVSLVVFRGPDAMTQATSAATMWRNETISSGELAGRFPNATRLDDLPATSLVPELAQFALRGPLDSVSEPLSLQGAVQLAKVVRFMPMRNGRFEDPDVQEELRELCRNLIYLEFRQQALERARDRTEVWITPELR